MNMKAICLLLMLAGVPGAGAGIVHLRIVEDDLDDPLPCRVRLVDAQGTPVLSADLPHWHDHFVCRGTATLELSPGQYRYDISCGPEYQPARGDFTVDDATPAHTLRASLKRIAHLAREGWWSGETHVHRDPEHGELLMQAEDLHVACIQTWWNDGSAWTGRTPPAQPVVQFEGQRFCDILSGEHERGGGALLFIGLKEPLPIAGSQHEHPPAMTFLTMAREQAGAWVDVEKPFWWDMPVWVASGQVDSIGIAHNHMQAGGVLDNEAWGKARHRAIYPGAHGNGHWTQDIYYHLLNAGLRLPPSAGSASGVLPNPVGYNRMYAHVRGELTWPKWWDAVRKGHVFVSNGPLLRVKANHRLPGEILSFSAGETLEVKLAGTLDALDPIQAVEIIRNGEVAQTVPADNLRGGVFATLTFQDSGWFLVRAIADVPETFRFASTGPFYVEVSGAPPRVSRRSAAFFRDWVRERMGRIQLDDPRQLDEVLAYQRQAEHFWQRTMDEATCE